VLSAIAVVKVGYMTFSVVALSRIADPLISHISQNFCGFG